MNQNEQQQQRELLNLQIKLSRLKIEAEYLKQQKLRNSAKNKAIDWFGMAKLATLAVSKRMNKNIPEKRQWEALGAWVLWQYLQSKNNKNNDDNK